MQLFRIFVGACSLIGMFALGTSRVPGKLVFWSSTQAGTTTSNLHYDTTTISPEKAAERLHKLALDNEHIVLLSSKKSNSQGILSFAKISNSVKSSQQATVLSNVLRTAEESDKTIGDHILSSDLKFRTMSLEDLVAKIGSADQVSRDATEVSVDVADPAHDALLTQLFSLSREKRVLFVTMQEPGVDVVAPSERADYGRLLETTTTSSATKPSAPQGGTEFSIYYEGTYLYITPDLFTGIMTALFMVAVALTGFSCMGSIQGMSTFYDKIPSNGKEA